MNKLSKEEILQKATYKLNKKKNEKKYLKICLKADVCPECGGDGLTTQVSVQDLKDPDLYHDYLKHKCGFTHITKSTHYFMDDDES